MQWDVKPNHCYALMWLYAPTKRHDVSVVAKVSLQY